MYYSRYSRKSPSASSAASNQRSSVQRSPDPSDFEYLGRLVTRERRPVVRKSKSIQQHLHFPQNRNKYQYSMGAHGRETHKTAVESSSAEDTDDVDALSKPLGVIRISDRHYREIYRLPTPPPKVKRVFHRLQSPEPKIIERVYVRRPPPQIIENVIEVPPEKVRIIKREKYLEKSTPITRSKLVHLRSRHHQQENEQQEQYEESYSSSGPYTQQQTATAVSNNTATQQPSTTTATKLVYPPQSNMRTVGYVTSTVPPEVMFNSQEPIQLSNQQITPSTPYDNVTQQPMMQPVPQQMTGFQMMPSTPYNPVPQQMTGYQMMPSSPYNPVSQQMTGYQMMPSSPYNPVQQPIQPVSQTVTNYQMMPSNNFNYPSQVPAAHSMIQPTSFAYPPQPSYGHTPFP